ncbi:elongation factor 3, partial [Phenoliferia sp. Uapishka_3]
MPIALDNMTSTDGSASAFLQEIYSATKPQARTAAAAHLAEFVQKNGLRSLALYGILDDLSRATKSKDVGEREGAMVAYEELFRKVGLAGGADPYFIPLLVDILDRYQESGKADVVRVAAEKAAKQLIRLPPPELAPKLIEQLFLVIESNTAKWRSKVGALDLLSTFAVSAKDQVAERLGDYVPRLSGAMRDTKPEISAGAFKAGINLCHVLTNPDIQPFVPTLVKCMADPGTVPDAIKRLSSTVWVREVDGPTLAVVAPLLTRALAERGNIVQRQTVILITNLFKLVRSNDLAALHSPNVLPGIDRIIESAAFPEIRAFAVEAKKAVEASIEGAASPAIDHMTESAEDEKAAFQELLILLEQETGEKPDAFFQVALQTVAFTLSQLVRKRSFDESEWNGVYIAPYLANFVGKEKADALSVELRKRWMAIEKARFKTETAEEDDEEGEIVCDLPFSLAYGGLLLLNHTTLKLRRGHRYGMCGSNGCGKSTLLKAINRKQIDNFPMDLKAAYVEHDIEGDESGITVVDLMKEEPRIDADEEEIRATLLELGFEPERQDVPILSLSGGWKMRSAQNHAQISSQHTHPDFFSSVALCRAMLMKVDLLLLDEPTNHLDVKSVAWLQDYLNAQTHITSMIVSHDSGFLDAVCTNIVHYQRKQLVYYQGNLAKFVEKNPAGKSYYTLSASVIKFTFPPPGSLMGVRSQTRAILKMTNCTFTYPGAKVPQLNNVSCAISLSSRVGIVGPNGAGKSTLIKLLTGETLPDSGRVEKHPNLRVAYVAQHAFHHIEEHLEKTASQYIQWRYQDGYDKEQATKATRALTPEEKKQMEVPIVGRTGEARKLERIVGRQKEKKSYKYEVKFVGFDHRQNAHLPREQLIELGFTKLIAEYDDLEASREGSGSREMSGKLVRKHLEDVGLDGDIAEYNELKGLSGGQKVKVVIAAAMWSKPQCLILDEPTNFLDRDALGGLAVGIKEWTGAFLCISHNQEFVSALCPEIWNVEGGCLTHKGKAAVVDTAFESQPGSAVGTPGAGTPNGSTPGGVTPSEGTPAGSGDEKLAAETLDGVDNALAFKAAKGKKKMSRKQMKDREERRRLRTVAWLSNSLEGAVREPDTDSDEEKDGKTLRIPSKKTKSGTTTPVIAGMK